MMTYGSGAAWTCAIDDVSLSFKPGQLSLVMGPSGSGKTTLLSVLGCLLNPDSGAVSVMGTNINALSEEMGKVRRQFIGYVFQAFRLFHSLSALENVQIGLEVSGCRGSRVRAIALESLDRVGLADKSRLRPHELSGGEKQRVAIARALVKDPPIVLADEPTASLDTASGHQIAQTLKGLAAHSSRIVVVVTHDDRWLALSDRTIRLEDGRVISDDGDRQ
jgi:putative ABC transport system ATP-binding protein